jgi:hypothetical protein
MDDGNPLLQHQSNSLVGSVDLVSDSLFAEKLKILGIEGFPRKVFSANCFVACDEKKFPGPDVGDSRGFDFPSSPNSFLVVSEMLEVSLFKGAAFFLTIDGCLKSKDALNETGFVMMSLARVFPTSLDSCTSLPLWELSIVDGPVGLGLLIGELSTDDAL